MARRYISYDVNAGPAGTEERSLGGKEVVKIPIDTGMANQGVRIFYSWESDSPAETNRNAIRAALKSAAKNLEAARPGLKVVTDEATRGVSGSPNIVAKIHEKIELCDIFIADITTVTSPRAKRPCPNPNVGYELGFAAAHIGWDRIILLFNEAFGKFPRDLPFDFAQHRAGTYKSPTTLSTAEKENLAKFLEAAIAMVLDQKPKRPAELRGVPREKLEHDHDVKNMKWLMRKIHMPTMDEHINEMPHKITDDAFWFWEHFKVMCCNFQKAARDRLVESTGRRLMQPPRTTG